MHTMANHQGSTMSMKFGTFLSAWDDQYVVRFKDSTLTAAGAEVCHLEPGNARLPEISEVNWISF